MIPPSLTPEEEADLQERALLIAEMLDFVYADTHPHDGDVEADPVFQKWCSMADAKFRSARVWKAPSHRSSAPPGARVFVHSGDGKGEYGTVVVSEWTDTPPHVELVSIVLDSGRTVNTQASRTVSESFAERMGKPHKDPVPDKKPAVSSGSSGDHETHPDDRERVPAGQPGGGQFTSSKSFRQ